MAEHRLQMPPKHYAKILDLAETRTRSRDGKINPLEEQEIPLSCPSPPTPD